MRQASRFCRVIRTSRASHCGNNHQISAISTHPSPGFFLYFLAEAAGRSADRAAAPEKDMKKAVTLIPIVLALAAASPALARAHHQYRSNPAPYGHIDSGWGPPANWNEIEISHPDCC
jgi:hypothetical protein